ncbi:tetratricopeptide repeat protein [Flavobacterium endophyticum]|uniref:Tetratricopeptide repeat protein n=1 Tax=Flavobacterium endophyticum TaxID=1540163 RepID=A0A495MC89_9FLAO|nr:tetratricopeptide repeat protein [Flavobacterium endophyticum]RKS21869.1 tetratricopeptide repeat protein [Flavobacterium endophyticum]
MKLKALFICFFILFYADFYSQEKTIDSLKGVLEHSKNDIDRTVLLNAIATEYMSSDPKMMQEYATKALELSQRIKYKIEEGNAYLNLGNVNVILGKYAAALDHFYNAQNIFETEITSDAKNRLEIKKGLARAYGSLGIVFSEQSNYAKALQYHLKAVKVYEEIKDEGRMARIYNNIGIVYQALKEDFKALDYFIKAQKLQEKTGDMTVGITTTNIGNIYLRQKNYPKALEYYTKSKNTFDKSKDVRGLGELYNNLGSYYSQTGNPTMALENWNKAIAEFRSIDDKFGISDTYSHLGNFYFSQKKYNEALENANNALRLAKELDVLEQTMNSQKLISAIYEAQNNPILAFQHYKLYTTAKDSLISHENIRKSVQAEMNFDFEKREALQEEAHEKKELLFKEQNKRYRLQTIFGALLVLLFFGIIFLIYNRMQLKKTLTLQKELAEYEQKALHLQMNPHFVFNCLGSISSFIVQNGTDSAIKYLSKFSKLMRLTLEYSKESLIPIDKEIEGLQNYLELEQLRSDKMFNFSITKSDEIEDDVALPPLLLQPFVENAILHGLIPKKEVGKIDIEFLLQGESLICTIVDNGIGFEKSQELKASSVSIHKSMALDITRKRLEMMEAVTSKTSKVEIKELKDDHGNPKGTEVILYLPIQYIK